MASAAPDNLLITEYTNSTKHTNTTQAADASRIHKSATYRQLLLCLQRSWFGFLEEPYKHAMVVELAARGLPSKREVPFDIVYRGVTVGTYRCDLVVNDSIIVEVKASRTLTEADERQLLNYLKASKIEVGFLLLFGPKPLFRRLIYTNDRK